MHSTGTQQRILITGAGGFVCSNITRVLLASGWYVLAVDRGFDAELVASWAAYADRLELLEVDTCALPATRVDAVIHGAAITARPEDRSETPEANFRANILPMLEVLAWAGEHCSGRTILLSSDAVFRRTPPGPFDENRLAIPLGLYPVAKLTMEYLAETLKTVYQRDVVAVRLGNIYGPHERIRETRPRISMVGQMIHNALIDKRIFVDYEDDPRDWTFAPDVGRAALMLLKMKTLQYALYHVASGQVYTQIELAEAINRQSPEIDVQFSAVPRAEIGLKRERQGHMVSTRLQRETGMDVWTSLTDGLQLTIDWFRTVSAGVGESQL